MKDTKHFHLHTIPHHAVFFTFVRHERLLHPEIDFFPACSLCTQLQSCKVLRPRDKMPDVLVPQSFSNLGRWHVLLMLKIPRPRLPDWFLMELLKNGLGTWSVQRSKCDTKMIPQTNRNVTNNQMRSIQKGTKMARVAEPSKQQELIQNKPKYQQS